MKLIIDNISNEIKEYLETQEGINKVEIKNKDLTEEINIEYDKRTTSKIILKYIELFNGNNFVELLGFDKETKGEYNTLKYNIEDMCCEYCYKGLVQDLYNNKYIKSVKSNFDFNKPAYNINFEIEYDKMYGEEELIDYIKDNYS